jgi:hypothetical protein
VLQPVITSYLLTAIRTTIAIIAIVVVVAITVIAIIIAIAVIEDQEVSGLSMH